MTPAPGTALDRLAEKIRHGHAAGLIPQEWATLAETAVLEAAEPWESEKAFRLRTGSSDKWCREHFAECEAEGLARRNEKGRREWHRHARLGRKKTMEPGALKREIVGSFHRRSA